LKRSSQPLPTALAIIFIISYGINLYVQQQLLSALWLIGISLGYILYRSGICFSAICRDPFLFNDFSTARAVLVLLIISFAGTFMFQIYSNVNGMDIPGKFHSWGVHTAIGGILFGIGMVLAGGCAAGTLQRIGEGFILFLIVLSGLVLGSTLGAAHFSWWTTRFASFKPLFLPEIFGWAAGGILTLTILGGLFYLTFVLEKYPSLQNKEDQTWAQKN